MAYQWKVILIQNTSGHSNDEIDITPYHSFQRSKLQPTAGRTSKPSMLYISFISTLSLDIRAKYEYWIGFRDSITNEWDGTRPIYAGYLGNLREGQNGTLHTFTARLDEYNFDLDTTDIEIWPDPASVGTGAPDGISVTEMMVGTTGTGATYDGLIVQNLAGDGGIEYDGVETAFDTITFSRSILTGTGVMPGGGTGEHPAYGTWGYTMLRTALDQIVEAANFIAPDMDPFYYLEPAISSADATKIRPRFCLVDGNDTSGTLVATFSTQPLAGEYQLYNPNGESGHEREASGARDRVTFKGAGTQTSGTTTPGDLVVATAYNSSRAINRTRYQTRPGRAIVYQDDTVRSKEIAASLAAGQEAINYDATGNLNLFVRHYVKPGSVIAVKVPEWGQTGTRYRVREVNNRSTPGVELWELIIGSQPQSAQGVLERRTRKAVALAQLRQAGIVPGSATPRPTVQNPTHSAHNVQMAQNDTTTARTTKPGYVPPGGTRTTDPIKREVHLRPDGTPGEWVMDADGTGHPHHYILGPITAAGVFYWVAPDAVRLVRVVCKDKDGTDVSGSVTLSGWKVQGISVSAPAPEPSPLIAAREDVIQVTVGGTIPTDGFTLLVSES